MNLLKLAACDNNNCWYSLINLHTTPLFNNLSRRKLGGRGAVVWFIPIEKLELSFCACRCVHELHNDGVVFSFSGGSRGGGTWSGLRCGVRSKGDAQADRPQAPCANPDAPANSAWWDEERNTRGRWSHSQRAAY